MFVYGLLKRRVPELVRFSIGDLPMYTFLILTHPYLPRHTYHTVKLG